MQYDDSDMKEYFIHKRGGYSSEKAEADHT